MATLLELSKDMQALDELLAEMGGDITHEQVETYITELFDETQGAFDEKVDRYCTLIREKELLAAARTQEAERIKMSAQHEANAAERLKDWLLHIMKKRNFATAGNVRTARLTNNGGKLPVDIDANIDAKTLPPRFQKVAVTVDIDEVRKALIAGDALKFATLGERGQHLRIK